ncbi:hypothetical protein FO519_006746 [Halicephalobus sp. NKZ332]|nr:hypothetical protein FO519_006746 [Halicephalobus sp. NKZ332]
MQKYLSVVIAIAVGLEPVFCCLGGFSSGGKNPDGSMDDNAFTTSPYFELSYSPPVEWTTPNEGSSGTVTTTTASTTTTSAGAATGAPSPTFDQAPTLDTATRRANTTVRLTLIDAMVSKSVMMTPGATYDFSQIVGQRIDLVSPSSTASAKKGDGLVEGNTVTNICQGGGPCNDLYVVTQTLQIKDGPLLSGRQWKDVANALQLALQLDGVRFNRFIVVSD